MKTSKQKPAAFLWIGVAIIVIYLLIALLAPWLAPYGESESVAGTWDPPSVDFWLGTDNIGRDIFSRLIYGARMTISMALATTLLSFFIGSVGGFLAASAGRWVDLVLSRFVDLMLSIPLLIFALIILSIFGSSIPILIITVALLDSTRVFRLARAVAEGIAVTEFVEVARLRGEGLWWVMRREILPNAAAPLIAEFGLRFCFNILFVAGLSFLGLGIQPPFADWGGMVRDNASAISFGLMAPLWPAMAIALMTVGVNLVVDWALSRNSRPSGTTAEV